MKTILEDFCEKNPNAKIVTDARGLCYPRGICPDSLGYIPYNCHEVYANESFSSMTCGKCWNRTEDDIKREFPKKSFGI